MLSYQHTQFAIKKLLENRGGWFVWSLNKSTQSFYYAGRSGQLNPDNG